MRHFPFHVVCHVYTFNVVFARSLKSSILMVFLPGWPAVLENLENLEKSWNLIGPGKVLEKHHFLVIGPGNPGSFFLIVQ